MHDKHSKSAVLPSLCNEGGLCNRPESDSK